MMRLYIVRHGETQWNAEARAQGSQNVQLTENGINQARLLANRIQHYPIHAIYSSDLDRAYETAKIIGKKINLEVNILNELREMSFGKWEGLTMDEIQQKYHDHYIVWRSTPHQAEIPDGERLLDVQTRSLKAVHQLLKRHKDQNILIVSHGVTIKSMILGLMDIELSNFYKIRQDNACLNIIEFREYGPVLVTLNDTAHLENIA
ncbi:MAG TPA: histidine phosphatase family protein [Clostridiales bacterium]|nr:histidine phosphatase family protein [Clostridiales bacterium]